jgi:hypothetical protein
MMAGGGAWGEGAPTDLVEDALNLILLPLDLEVQGGVCLERSPHVVIVANELRLRGGGSSEELQDANDAWQAGGSKGDADLELHEVVEIHGDF